MRAIASPFVPTYRGAHLRSALQATWDKFGFVAPRRSSVVLSKGAGAFSFTRATTATVEDWEGAIRVCKSGEVRFPGARRVENFCINTGFLAGTVDGSPGTAPTGVSISSSVAGITRTIAHGEDVYGKYLEVRFVGTNNSGSVFYGACYSMASNAVPAVVGQTWVVSGKVALVAGVWPSQARIQLSENSSAPAYLTASTDLINAKVTGASPVYLSLSRTLSNASCAYAQPSIAGFQINNGEVVDFTARVYEPQFENVTGQSNQNPSEYVSVGVLSSPFHGAMVDGVKYLEHQNGNTVASNVVTEAMGATLTTCKGQLDETASTNLVLQSSNFGASWLTTGTPTRSAAAKYCGSIALDLIGDDAGGALEEYYQQVAFTGDAVKSVSFLAHPDTSTSTVVRLRDTTAGTNRLLAAITWSGGVPTVTYTTGSEERPPKALAGGVYRIFCKTASVTAANANFLSFFPATDAALAVGMTGSVYIGGVQAENATTASSHIPTTTATVARNADDGSYPSSGNVASGGGTIYAEFEIDRASDAAQYIADVSNGTANERIVFYRNTDNNLYALVVDGGVVQANFVIGVVPVGVPRKLAARWAPNDIAAVISGGAVQADTSATLPDVTTIYPGRYGGGANRACSPTKNLRISQQLLSNAELLALVA